MCKPGIQTAVEYRDPLVPDPSQQPPQSRSDGARDIIVENHLSVVPYAPAGQGFYQLIRVRQRVATIRRANRCGEIVIEMGVSSSRYMPFTVRGEACIRLGKLKSTIDDNPVGLANMSGERLGVYQGGRVHAPGDPAVLRREIE